MATAFEENTLRLSLVCDDRDLEEIRNFFAQVAPNHVTIDMRECKDAHTAVLQLLLSYKLIYGASFLLGDTATAYKKTIEGFDVCEDDSSI